MLIEIRGEIEEIRMITAFGKEINSHPQRSDADNWTPNKQPINTLLVNNRYISKITPT